MSVPLGTGKQPDRVTAFIKDNKAYVNVLPSTVDLCSAALQAYEHLSPINEKTRVRKSRGAGKDYDTMYDLQDTVDTTTGTSILVVSSTI